jgi:hypothetical protein
MLRRLKFVLLPVRRWNACARTGAMAAGLMMALGTGQAVQAAEPAQFQVKSYGGKCLDYGTRPGVTGPDSVFLNDCALAHAIGVEEIDANHDVVLNAGSRVIGIHNPPANTTGGPPPPPATEYALELQPLAQAFSPERANQIFALDGDSIILTASRPCMNSDQATSPCPSPPPEIVVQVQNGRGANFSPIVAAERRLASFEFWDFNAVDGSGRFPTSGFVTVSSNQALWNAICKEPAATADTPPRAIDPGQPDDGFYLAEKCRTFNVGPGSVIVVQNDVKECALYGNGIGPCVDLTYYPPVILPSGVTLRSDRRGTNLNGQIYSEQGLERETQGACGWCMLEIRGDYVRVTGLRLRGPSRSPYAANVSPEAIAVDWVGPDSGPLFGVQTTTEYIATVDHNDVSDWQGATVNVYGPYDQDTGKNQCNVLSNGANIPKSCSCAIVDPVTQRPTPVVDDAATLANVKIERNFLHHNEQSGFGYGSVMSHGGRAVVLANTFLANRHAIASSGEPHNEYRAWYNLVETYVPDYTWAEAGSLSDTGRQQDFDMHGTGPGGYGWVGGYELDIAANTFLGGNRFNFELRGHPCHTIYFRDNVTQRTQTSGGGNVINFHKVGSPGIPFHVHGPDIATSPVTTAPDDAVSQVFDEYNQFGNSNPAYANPGARLAVGDFDGDGVQDLFMATGTAWYYSPGGVAEWRFLNAQSGKIDSLLFGDFDGDGRTDVVQKDGNRLMVSWGGESDWEVLNAGPVLASISDMAVGHFTDRDPKQKGPWRDDIFLADGKQWFVSEAGSGPFVAVQTSSFRVKDLRFGNFDKDPKTDVMGVEAGRWRFSSGARSSWTPMAVSLTNTVAPLVVADFNGDGLSDIAVSSNGIWMVSYGGATPWSSHAVPSANGCAYLGLTSSPIGDPPWATFTLASAAGVGRFKGTSESQALVWNGRGLCMVDGLGSSAGPWTIGPWSRQDMN